MRYRLFLLRTTAYSKYGPEVEAIIDHIVQRYYVSTAIETVAYMVNFDVEQIKAQLEKEVGEKCRITVKYAIAYQDKKPYLYLSAPYEVVSNVLPRVWCIAAENDLVLYDSEKDKVYYRDLIDPAFVSARIRENAISQRIMQADHHIWHYERMKEYMEEGRRKIPVVVTLRKECSLSIEERTECFYNTLSNSLVGGESLICENKCFTIEGPEYAIIYSLEAYKKHACMMGYYEDGKPCTGLMYRMGAWEAIEWMRTLSEQEKKRIWTEMCTEVMLKKYRNPGDRFIACVNNEKQLRRDLRLACKKRI